MNLHCFKWEYCREHAGFMFSHETIRDNLRILLLKGPTSALTKTICIDVPSRWDISTFSKSDERKKYADAHLRSHPKRLHLRFVSKLDKAAPLYHQAKLLALSNMGMQIRNEKISNDLRISELHEDKNSQWQSQSANISRYCHILSFRYLVIETSFNQTAGDSLDQTSWMPHLFTLGKNGSPMEQGITVTTPSTTIKVCQ